MFLAHSQLDTPGKTPLNRRSARRRNRFLHNTTNTRDANPCPQSDSNPRSHKSSGCLKTAQPPGSTYTSLSFQPLNGKRPHPYLWAGSRAARGKRNSKRYTYLPKNYCEIFMVYTQFTNVAAGLLTQPGGPRVGDP